MAVNPDDRGIDHGVFHVGIVRDRLEHAFENMGLDPMAKALEDGVPLAKRCWQITPGTASSRDPQHRFNKQTSVTASLSESVYVLQRRRKQLQALGIYEDASPQELPHQCCCIPISILS